MWRWWSVLAALALVRAEPGPGLRWERPHYNLTLEENSPPRTAARAPPPAPPPALRVPRGSRCRLRLRHGDKDKLFRVEERVLADRCLLTLRTRAAHGDVLNRERRDRYELEVHAAVTPPGAARQEATARVTLLVTDQNDLSPLFYPTEYSAEVAEDAPLLASVARVAAEDADLGLAGEIYYSLAERDPHFAVEPASGVVSLTRALDAARPLHELTVLAQDRAARLARGDAAPAARARLTVRVLPANRHAPRLRALRPPADPPGGLLLLLEATDEDAGAAGRVAAVDVVDGDPDGHLRVLRSALEDGAWELRAHALAPLDSPREYNVTLRARDAGSTPREGYLTVPVRVGAEPRAPPVFSKQVYEATVAESAPPRTPLVRLRVAERGADARVHIEIVGGNEGGEFSVHAESGVLYTAARLDAERAARYTLTVSAVDGAAGGGARLQSSAKVQVTVLDVNDNDPVFERAELDVALREDAPAGELVAQLLARDADSGENAYVSYSIANLQPVPFEVEHFTGAVRSVRALDYESARRDYTLLVRASDWGSPYRRQAEARVRVRLQDVNDNRPQFERVACAGPAPRALPPGAELLTLSAIDFDAGDVVSYRLVGGNDDGCFALDAATGVLSVACDLRGVREDARVLNVTATDGTHFADTTSVALRLTAGGAAALECRDAGVARRLGALLAAAERANAPPPRDDPPAEPPRYDDNLHAPEFLDFPVEVKVNESVALGTRLLRLRARDRDRGYNGLVSFAISDGDADSAFRVDPDSGELTVIGYLDRERAEEYFLNVTAWDSGSPPRAASRLLPVTVLDVNDEAPRFVRPLASFRVTENALNGTAVFVAEAVDRDAGAFGRVTYSLPDGPREFCVEPARGELRVCGALDRERRASYELRLRATDGGGLSAHCVVRVQVDDVNDEAPRFPLQSYSARVREDVPAGALVALLAAHDPDLGAGGRVRYSIPEPGDDPAFVVDERSGAVRTARALDYETRPVLGVTVRATDGGSPPLWADATLVVELQDVDENLHAPAWPAAALALAVREDAAPGAAVARLAATDADAPGRDSRLHYYLAGGAGLAHFAIDDAGALRTAGPLDREARTHHWLTVCAEDLAVVPKYSCVEVVVEVEDVNDVAPWPAAPLQELELEAAGAAGELVATLRAPDGDAAPRPRNVTYTIVAGNPDGLFTIDEFTGAVRRSGRALGGRPLLLEAACSDGQLAARARLLLRPRPRNDHAPAFAARRYALRVPATADTLVQDAPAEESLDSDDEEAAAADDAGWEERAAPPPDAQLLTTLVALDPDPGPLGAVRYSARGGAGAAGAGGAGAALMLTTDGALYQLRPFAVHEAHHLIVRACDGGAPARCGRARVLARGAAPGGGAPPTLPPPPPLAAAELDAPGFLLALLQAADPDGDALYYTIVDGDPDRDFAIGREDGSLVLARPLQHERRARYSLTVRVSDGNSSALAAVNISVVNDVNEGGLRFSQDVYSCDVAEDAAVGSTLLTLAAAAGPGGGADVRVVYGAEEAREPASLPLFRVDGSSGAVLLARPLDREAAARHELTVWARDGAPRASRAFARLVVTVRDVDEHAPRWGRALAAARLPAAAAPGTLVADVRAEDPDAAAAPLRYRLAGAAARLFSVDAQGAVRLERALPPPPAPREYTLQVHAEAAAADAELAPRAPALPLHIVVVDEPDTPPVFEEQPASWEVSEAAAAGAAVGTLAARADSSLRYELRARCSRTAGAAGGADHFSINPFSGSVHVAAPLDSAACDLYNLTIVATTATGGTASQRARVRVRAARARARLRARAGAAWRGVLREDAAPGALVLRADGRGPLVLRPENATQADLRFARVEVAEAAAASQFAVRPDTWALQLRAPLDYEDQPEWNFTVAVIEEGWWSYAAVSVAVRDVNDCAPRFPQREYRAELLLPTAEGVVVLYVNASDADTAAARLRYDVVDGEDAAGGALRADGGAVRVTAAGARRLQPGELRLRLRASDGQLSGTARLRVTVRAAAAAGLAFTRAEYRAVVQENDARARPLAVLDVLGTALNDHVTFHLLNPQPAFRLGETSGALWAAGAPLDRERRAEHELLVLARAGEREARARVLVAVSDVNDNCPRWVRAPLAGWVRAGAAPGAEVARLEARDADAGDNGEVRYEMKRGPAELFALDRRSGRLTLRQAPDAHAANYTLQVAAFDGGWPACSTSTTVAVRVVAAGAPAWPAARVELAVREDAPLAAPLAAPLVADSPLQRDLIYTLLRPELTPEFELKYDTGVLTLTSPLDFERRAEYELTVRAQDAATGARADADVVLRVLDVNDNAPRLPRAEYRVALSEAAEPGLPLLSVPVADDDSEENGRITCSVRHLWESDAPLPLTVETVGGADGAACELRAAGGADRERGAELLLLLEATDAGVEPLRSAAVLRVTLTDVNDNPPRLERADWAAAASGDAAEGTPLLRVAAWDPDDGDELRYELWDDTARRYFELDAAGLLRLADPRAWAERARPLSFNVSVSDGAHAAAARVTVTPAPRNAHAPRFTHVLYEARVDENLPPPALLTTVKAEDEDEGELGAVTYSIPSPLLRETFEVDPRSGAVRTRVPLDREARGEWTLAVAARDGGGREAHTAVRVRVQDRNEHAPAFPLLEYRAAAPAAAAPGAALLAVAALDADATDTRLRYSLRDDDAAPPAARGLLQIHPDTGEISFTRNASALEGTLIGAWVRAEDAGGRAGAAPLSLHVGGGGACPALPPALFLREDAAPGALLAELRGAARLRLAEPRRPAALALRGRRLELAAALDRECAPLHHAAVLCWREAAPRAVAMAPLRLHVLDVNDHAPVFHAPLHRLALPHALPAHTSIIQLVAEDADAGLNGEVHYSLEEEQEEQGEEEQQEGGGEELGPALLVEPGSGWVVTRRRLTRPLRAWVRAQDAGAPPRSARAELRLRLLRRGARPPAFRQESYSAEIPEDSAPGTLVTTLYVKDGDAGSAPGAPLSYYVVSGDPRARFTLQPLEAEPAGAGAEPAGAAAGRGARLLLARGLDREAAPRYALRVLATDGKYAAWADVHVTVGDVNDNRPVCARDRYHATLSEDAAPGAAVVTAAATDGDGDELRWELSGGGAENFRVDGGRVTLAAPLDREAAASYRLTVTARDSTWSCAAELRVDVADVNDHAPHFSPAAVSAALPEDAEPGVLVAKLSASDADAGANRLLRYELAEAADGFRLDARSGALWLAAPLDRERAPTHVLRVRARDGGAPPREAAATLTLTVTDVNDNPPAFTQRRYEAVVPELDAVGSQVIRVEALSADAGENAEVTYAIVGGAGAGDFSVDAGSGAVRVARPLDRERAAEYRLTLQATDRGAPPLSDRAELVVRVADANDNAPVFTQSSYSAAVREDAAPGALVATVAAADADAGEFGRVRYWLADDGGGLFRVEPHSGRVLLAAALDRERAPAHALQLRAADHGAPPREAAALLAVRVLDANDNPPRFDSDNYTAVVQEGRAPGALVLRLGVTDADAPPNGPPFTFDFQAGNEAGAFRLEQDGSLRTAARLSHRAAPRLTLSVRVFDNGAPPLFADATVTVHVVEQSQYPPVVTPLEVQVISYRDSFPGGALGVVRAEDRDRYDVLTYALSGAPAGLFAVDAASGALSCAPRPPPGDYRLNVTASDGRFTGAAAVRVRVLAAGDELLARAAVVRFRGVGAGEFVLAHRRGFLRAVREAARCEPEDVVLLGVQPAGAGQLDVAVAAPLPAEALRARLHAHLESLEERARLVVEALLRATCAGCGRGRCEERLVLGAEPRLAASDVFALAAPAHRLEARCRCEPGYGGERCERALCGEEACGAARVLRLGGDGLLEWRPAAAAVALEGARPLEDALDLSLRLRTWSTEGTLAWAGGHYDYLVLEVAGGAVQARVQLGGGEARARVPLGVADGAWHAVRLQRRGAALRLAVDGREATAAARGAVLDAPARLVLGATLAPSGPQRALLACVAELREGGAPLPLEAPGEARGERGAEGAEAADAERAGAAGWRLLRRENAPLAPNCEPPPPTPCSSHPCLNGGTCSVSAVGGWQCACAARFSGAACELDSEPCAGGPCLHGGACRAAPELPRGYECDCPPPAAGERCQRGVFCTAGACPPAAACEDGVSGPSCRCRGYYGPDCALDVDECAAEPCAAGSTCLNTPGSYACVCPAGRTGAACADPLAGAVLARAPDWRALWEWARAAQWPLWAAGAAAALLLLLAALAALACRPRRPPPPPPRDKLTNLRRERPASAADAPAPLNNVDTLRSYGSAGDELEGIPPDYLRNLNLEPDRKPWSEQMHLHTFTDNKIYNDLKGSKAPAPQLAPARSPPPALAGAALGPALGPAEGLLAGGYHWDCSDWCGSALPAITEVTAERRSDTEPERGDDGTLRLRLRDPDASSLITMLEERSGLLDDCRSLSSGSARLCEIEDSDADPDPDPDPDDPDDPGERTPLRARHTAV